MRRCRRSRVGVDVHVLWSARRWSSSPPSDAHDRGAVLMFVLYGRGALGFRVSASAAAELSSHQQPSRQQLQLSTQLRLLSALSTTQLSSQLPPHRQHITSPACRWPLHLHRASAFTLQQHERLITCARVHTAAHTRAGCLSHSVTARLPFSSTSLCHLSLLSPCPVPICERIRVHSVADSAPRPACSTRSPFPGHHHPLRVGTAQATPRRCSAAPSFFPSHPRHARVLLVLVFACIRQHSSRCAAFPIGAVHAALPSPALHPLRHHRAVPAAARQAAAPHAHRTRLPCAHAADARVRDAGVDAHVARQAEGVVRSSAAVAAVAGAVCGFL